MFKIAKNFQTAILFQTVALIGQAIFLLLISHQNSFEGALFCMAMAMACGGFHNSGVLVNPQDIAPQYAGSVFGKLTLELLTEYCV